MKESEQAKVAKSPILNVKKEKNYKKLAATYKGQVTRLKKLLKHATTLNTVKLNTAIEDVRPNAIQIKRSDIFQIVNRYNQLVAKELNI